MKVKNIIVGPIQGNCYIVYDEKSLDAMVIDPGDEAGKIIRRIEENNLKVRYIVCTHGHFDHIGAVAEVKKKTGAKVVINKKDSEIYKHAGELAASWGFHIEQPTEPDLLVEDGAELVVGSLQFRVLATPGHSPGGICLYGQGVLFTGDTIFAGSVGRTDLYGGDMGELRKSFVRLISLPSDTKVLPGHGSGSTIGKERIVNFFVREV
jgi:hydroxyacylglutathione hydrolase